MADTDPSSVGEYSDDSDYESDIVDIMTDNMRSTRLAPMNPHSTSQRNNPEASQTPRNFNFRYPLSQLAKMNTRAWETDRAYHNGMFPPRSTNNSTVNNVHLEEIKTTPLFSADVLASAQKYKPERGAPVTILPQYGLVAKMLDKFDGQEKHNLLGLESEPLVDAFRDPYDDPRKVASKEPEVEDDRLFVNMNSPWSAFICGSQGSGKSHTLSCMLENALLPSQLGRLPNKLAGMVFHYDKFTGFASTQPCEAAYLASSGIPVKVLVSPSNQWRMEQVYRNLPGFPKGVPKPVVVPLLLHEKQLNVERMMKLMAVDEKDGKMALYMESVCRILRSMAMKNQGRQGLDFDHFTRRLELETLNEGQKAMLNTRLQLLKSFMYLPEKPGVSSATQKKPQFPDTKKGREQERKWWVEEDARERAKIGKANSWTFEPGSLTIIDLSCPFVDEGAACAMFNICLALFLEDRAQAGRIVALDEAHKFMTATDSSSQFTESLLSVIRQQRHLATRVIIATQEPTISPALLDLSSMTIVHRFTSPAWLRALKSHLAGVTSEGESTNRNVSEIFKRIVELDAGEALLFSPSAMLGVEGSLNANCLRMQKLGTGYAKVQIRMRLTADGGRSILAT